jgi:hypothetical protein
VLAGARRIASPTDVLSSPCGISARITRACQAAYLTG